MGGIRFVHMLNIGIEKLTKSPRVVVTNLFPCVVPFLNPLL